MLSQGPKEKEKICSSPGSPWGCGKGSTTRTLTLNCPMEPSSVATPKRNLQERKESSVEMISSPSCPDTSRATLGKSLNFVNHLSHRGSVRGLVGPQGITDSAVSEFPGPATHGRPPTQKQGQLPPASEERWHRPLKCGDSGNSPSEKCT